MKYKAMKKALGAGIIVIGMGIFFLFRAYSNVIDFPHAFSGNGIVPGENYDYVVIATVIFAVAGIALILYGIRKIRETKQEEQVNQST